ncbi:MAG: hypothetical protein AAB620_00940 [Patescibacteria group bacterium]
MLNQSVPLLHPALPASAKLLWDSWLVFKSRWHIFAGIAAIAFIGNAIYMLISAVATVSLIGLPFVKFSLLDILFLLILLAFLLANIILQLWMAVAIIYAVKNRKERPSLKDILRQAWPRITSFTWVGLLVILCIFGGLLLLVIPGIIFSIWLCFSLNVFIDEGLKGRQALKRSRQLTKGKWVKTFWRLLVFLIFAVAIIILPGFIAWLTKIGRVGQIGGMAVWIFLMPFTTIYGYLLYEAAKQTSSAN